ncbi:hypothetical protein SZ64_08725 [Erythrobacter sp. SG61-1L]|uniref:DUF3617 domain-containing protein n=1 Tax=Erythrobacter sp. SG61-1L TaxID=1603897 RepID=UPI0006D6F4A0|nr:DUF3617 domain-containing protein [Erythrobacter sp. SG61-1L]KPL68197.1 hypothetical protein SZ64_08725 [Erythrobacter sp. SG61-1L]
MRKLVLLPIVAAIALAGCGKKEEAPAGGEAGGEAAKPAEAVAAGLDTPQPGLYKQTVEVLEMSIPGMPAAMAAQMKQSMSANMELTDCLTPEEAKEAVKQLTSRGMNKESNCTYDKFDVSGGAIDAVMKCDGENGGSGTFKLSGSFSSTGSDMTVEGDQVVPDMPGGKMHMKMHMVSERIGECKG